MWGASRLFKLTRAFGFITLTLLTLVASPGTGRAQSSSDGQKTNWTNVAILGGVLVGLALASLAINNYNVAQEAARKERAAEEAARRTFYEQPPNTVRRSAPAGGAPAVARIPASFQIPASLELHDTTIVAPERVTVHASPRANAAVVGVIQTGQGISVYGVVPPGQWALVGRSEQPLGYMRLTQPLTALLQN
jgi:hypothetical protein